MSGGRLGWRCPSLECALLRFPNHFFDVVTPLAVLGPGQGPAVLKLDWGLPYASPVEARREPFCKLSKARLGRDEAESKMDP